VLRREQAAPEPREEAAPAAARPTRSAGAHGKRAASHKQGATRPATTAKKVRATGRNDADPGAPARRSAKRPHKRT